MLENRILCSNLRTNLSLQSCICMEGNYLSLYYLNHLLLLLANRATPLQISLQNVMLDTFSDISLKIPDSNSTNNVMQTFESSLVRLHIRSVPSSSAARASSCRGLWNQLALVVWERAIWPLRDAVHLPWLGQTVTAVCYHPCRKEFWSLRVDGFVKWDIRFVCRILVSWLYTDDDSSWSHQAEK